MTKDEGGAEIVSAVKRALQSEDPGAAFSEWVDRRSEALQQARREEQEAQQVADERLVDVIRKAMDEPAERIESAIRVASGQLGHHIYQTDLSLNVWGSSRVPCSG